MSVRGWQWAGWVLFSLSAIGFIIASWRAGDMVALWGAIAFMAANAAFIVAHWKEDARDE